MESIRHFLGNYSYNLFKRDAKRLSRFYAESFIRNFRKPEKDIDVEASKIDDAVWRGIKWLESMQRNDGSVGSREYEVWETANAVLAFFECDYSNSEVIKRAASFLTTGKLKNGGYFYMYFPPKRKELEKDIYCIETTAVVAIALIKYYGEINDEIRDLVYFLLEKQHVSGGWFFPHFGDSQNINLNGNFYPSVTGYALEAIVASDINAISEMEKAIKFLASTQRADGSWGRSKLFYNTESYAIKNIVKPLMLIKTHNQLSNEDRIIKNSISYVKRAQNADGSWSNPGPSSKSLSTALFLQSLIYTGEERFAGLVANWLIKHQQKDGSWYGGTLAGVNSDVFVTSEVLIALSNLRRCSKFSTCG